jgi:acetyl-CoA acetyltransferase
MTMSTPEPLYILGAGMHPWGKWGRDFTEYGVVAARAALAEAGLDWRQIQLVAGADTIRNGYPGFIAGSTFAQKLGWNGVPVSSSYAACASGSQALQSARAHILAGFCRHHAEGGVRAGRRRTQERPGLAAIPPHRCDEPGVLRAAGSTPDGPLRGDV